MKSEYKTPTISVELLYRADVLLNSEGNSPGGDSGNTEVNTPALSERENRYFSFCDLERFM